MTYRIAITGVGGPAGISLMQALAGDEFEVIAGDTDPYAPGLYFTRPDQRWILHPGDDPRFVDDLLARCVAQRIDVVIPTVDTELFPLASRAREFERSGIRLVLASHRTLAVTLDKATLIAHCEGVCPVPRTAIFDADTDLAEWEGRCVLKPRIGGGIRLLEDGRRISNVPRDGSHVLQEYLPGDGHAVDTLCDLRGNVIATVPRSSLKTDDGVTVTGATFHDAILEQRAAAVATHLGITFVASIRFRRDAAGTARLLDLSARFPGTMPLTTASGVNMPRLAVDLVLGRLIAEGAGEFRDIGMVRVWREQFVDTGEIEALGRVASRHHARRAASRSA